METTKELQHKLKICIDFSNALNEENSADINKQFDEMSKHFLSVDEFTAKEKENVKSLLKLIDIVDDKVVKMYCDCGKIKYNAEECKKCYM